MKDGFVKAKIEIDNEMNTHKSKHTKKQVDIDAKRHEIVEMETCISIFVLTCCCNSILKYVFILVLLCINIFVCKCRLSEVIICRITDNINYRCNDAWKYGLNDLLMQRCKSMNIKRFAQINQYFFT